MRWLVVVLCLWALPVWAEQYAYVLAPVIGTGTGDDPYRPSLADLKDPGAAPRLSIDDDGNPITVHPGYGWVAQIPSKADGSPKFSDALCLVKGQNLSAVVAAPGITVLGQGEDKASTTTEELLSTLDVVVSALSKRAKEGLDAGRAKVGLTPTDSNVTVQDAIEAIGRSRDATFAIENLRVR